MTTEKDGRPFAVASNSPGWEGHGAEVTVSIVVATRNRAQQLDRCLAAMRRVDSSTPWELIVVDNGSTDHTAAIVGAHRDDIPNLILVREDRQGLGFAKDAGLRAARGSIVAFTDDDCYLTTTFVDDVKSEFDAHPHVAAMGGRILLYDPLDLPLTINESPEPVTYPPASFVPAGAVQGANSSFRRLCLLEVGGFDTRMGAGTPFAAEDIDAFARVIWAGHHGRYSPLPTVYHHHGRRTQEDRRALEASYDLGRGAYFAKFIERRDSRSAYIRRLARSVVADVIKNGNLQRTKREFSSGLRWYRVNGARRGLLKGDPEEAPAGRGRSSIEKGWRRL